MKDNHISDVICMIIICNTRVVKYINTKYPEKNNIDERILKDKLSKALAYHCYTFFSISQTVDASRLYGGKVGLASCLLFGVGLKKKIIVTTQMFSFSLEYVENEREAIAAYKHCKSRLRTVWQQFG